MLRIFNAFQIVTLFAAMPFILGWLDKAEFGLHSIAYYLAAIVYGVLFIAHIISLSMTFADYKW